jgi:hypothetical protein
MSNWIGSDSQKEMIEVCTLAMRLLPREGLVEVLEFLTTALHFYGNRQAPAPPQPGIPMKVKIGQTMIRPTFSIEDEDG